MQPQWIAVTERMPEPGTECIVWSPGNAQHGPFAFLDTWDEQREAPVSFSTLTVPVGLAWGSSDFDEITHWMPLPPAPGAEPTAPSAQTEDERQLAPRRPLGCALAMRVLQSDMYTTLDDAERADCDELVQRNLEWFRRPA